MGCVSESARPSVLHVCCRAALGRAAATLPGWRHSGATGSACQLTRMLAISCRRGWSHRLPGLRMKSLGRVARAQGMVVQGARLCTRQGTALADRRAKHTGAHQAGGTRGRLPAKAQRVQHRPPARAHELVCDLAEQGRHALARAVEARDAVQRAARGQQAAQALLDRGGRGAAVHVLEAGAGKGVGAPCVPAGQSAPEPIGSLQSHSPPHTSKLGSRLAR